MSMLNTSIMTQLGQVMQMGSDVVKSASRDSASRRLAPRRANAAPHSARGRASISARSPSARLLRRPRPLRSGAPGRQGHGPGRALLPRQQARRGGRAAHGARLLGPRRDEGRRQEGHRRDHGRQGHERALPGRDQLVRARRCTHCARGARRCCSRPARPCAHARVCALSRRSLPLTRSSLAASSPLLLRAPRGAACARTTWR